MTTRTRRLAISSRNLGDAARLISAPGEPIEHLRLASRDGDAVPSELAAALASGGALAGVRRVEVEGIDLGGGALAAITGSASFAQLEELSLIECDWKSQRGVEIARELAGSSLAKLRSLELAQIEIGGAGLKALAHSATLVELRRLRIAGGRVGDDGLTSLAESPLWDQLEAFFLDDRDVTVEGVRRLLSGKRSKRVTQLSILIGGSSNESASVIEAALGAGVAVRPSAWWTA